jgi:hypothetical protein
MVQFISTTNSELIMSPGRRSVRLRRALKNLKDWLNGIICAIHHLHKAIAILPYKMVKFRTSAAPRSNFDGCGTVEMELT